MQTTFTPWIALTGRRQFARRSRSRVRSKSKNFGSVASLRRTKAAFELDHIIPLALGGSPDDPRDLQLEPWEEAGEKDNVEARLTRAVCVGGITLDEARRRIWSDWRRVGLGSRWRHRAAQFIASPCQKQEMRGKSC